MTHIQRKRRKIVIENILTGKNLQIISSVRGPRLIHSFAMSNWRNPTGRDMSKIDWMSETGVESFSNS